jgi:hypothetical protein
MAVLFADNAVVDFVPTLFAPMKIFVAVLYPALG